MARFTRTTARVLAVVLALTVAAVGGAWWAAMPAAPDAFYQAPPGPADPAGTLLRSEAFARAVPSDARAWRILYATTRADGSPAIASAVVVAPMAGSNAPHPVIAWAHGTTGLAPGCAPSVLANPFLHVPAMRELLERGWAYVASDYIGLGAGGAHAYLVGVEAAHAVLDAVRAARQIDSLRLDRRAVVWGHSQGGNSALFAGMIAPRYGADVNLIGVAALAPASDLVGLLPAAQATMFGKIVSAYLVRAYDDIYPDTNARSYLRPGVAWLVNDIAGRCVGGRETLFSAVVTLLLPRGGIFARAPTEGAFAARLAENVPGGPFAAPVLIAQGESDDLVLPQVQRGYVAARCAAGQALEYRAYRDRDHISLLAADSPASADLVRWTAERFSGAQALPNCRQP
jgi:alpha-beta hydrolase superfamily lysophospholipase